MFCNILVAIAFVSLFFNTAMAAIPGADNPKTTTGNDVYREVLAFNQKTLSGAFKQVGQRDPKWDAQAIAVLDAMAAAFSSAGLHPVYLPKEVLPPVEILKLAEAARNAGCRDPLVTYVHAAVLSDMQRRQEAAPLLREAAKGLLGSKYPANRIIGAARRVSRTLHNPEDAALNQACERAVTEQLVGLFSRPIAKEDFRGALDTMGDFEALGISSFEALAMCAKIEASKEADPYIVDLLYGRTHVRRAWDFRGGGWANTVTDAGWKGFHEQLDLARVRLTRAYKARPDLPHAPTMMITVVLGAADKQNETERDWFNKAATAQIDFSDAYSRYVNTILPRWGGSHEEMLAFAKECVDTGRYDTMVPFYAIDVIGYIDNDAQSHFKIYEDDAAYAVLTAVFDGIQTKSTRADKMWFRSVHIALAWRTGRYDDAVKQLDGMDLSKFRMDAFGFTGGWGAMALSELFARKAQGDALKAALQTPAGDDAVRQFETVLAALPKDHPGRDFVGLQIRLSRLESDLTGGQWASLKPNESLFPWRVVHGEWKREADGTLVGTSGNDNKAILELAYDLGQSLEIKMKVTIPESNFATTRPAGRPAVVQFGVLPLYWPEYRVAGTINTGSKTAAIAMGAEKLERNVQIGNDDELLVRVDQGQMTVMFNGQVVAKPLPVHEGNRAKPVLRMGIEGVGPGRTVRVRDIEVRLDPSQR